MDLAPFVETFWETIGTVHYGYEKIVPSGNAEIMINLGVPQLVLDDPTSNLSSSFHDSWLCGVQTRPLFTAPAIGNKLFSTHFVGARLLPISIKSIFGVDALDTVDHVVELENLIGLRAHELHNRVAQCSNTAGRFSQLAQFLRNALQKERRSGHVITNFAVRRTIEAKGNIRIQEICTAAGISRKHLSHLYKTTVGVTPKMFARLTRFRSVMDQLNCCNNSWVKVATDNGYFDQSHLISDFKQFAGESPAGFLENRAPDGESVNYLDRPEKKSSDG